MLVQRLLAVTLFTFFLSTTISEAWAQAPPRIRPNYGGAQGKVGTQNPTAPRGQAGGKILDAQPAVNRIPVVPKGPPKEFQLTDAQQNRIDSMLNHWQTQTAKINTFSCKFGRWVYDPVFGPKNVAARFTTGEIRYAAVDKGMIREEAVYVRNAAKPNERTPSKKSDEIGEHWVCTGTSVFEYDHKGKKLNEIKLPPQMQGKAIAEGPLPFMFGAKAESIKRRYWIREIPQKKDGDPYHLEFLPRQPGEAHSLIQIKLDTEKFLPTQMVLWELNKMGRSSYAFKDLKVNSPAHKVGAYFKRFVAPTVPKGYELIIHDSAVQHAEAPKPEKR